MQATYLSGMPRHRGSRLPDVRLANTDLSHSSHALTRTAAMQNAPDPKPTPAPATDGVPAPDQPQPVEPVPRDPVPPAPTA